MTRHSGLHHEPVWKAEAAGQLEHGFNVSHDNVVRSCHCKSIEKRKTNLSMCGILVVTYMHTCSYTNAGGWNRTIAWAWEFETIVNPLVIWDHWWSTSPFETIWDHLRPLVIYLTNALWPGENKTPINKETEQFLDWYTGGPLPRDLWNWIIH